MRYRKLGRTGFQISEIGFGTWGLGGDAYGPTDDAESQKCLRRAFDLGVNFFDTSNLYGNGRSEKVLGSVLTDVRKQVCIATKGGLLPHRGFEMPSDFSPVALKTALAESLDRLQTDYVDLYLLHSPDLTQMRENAALWDTLGAMRRSGQVRALGLSARSPADAHAALDLFAFDAIQVNFNLIDQRAHDIGLLQTAEDRGVAVIARTPLCFGYLTGKLSGNETFSELDHRANWPDGQLKRWAQSPGLFDRLCSRRNCTPSQLALLFCLSPSAVVTTIPGMMNLAEVEDDVAASDLSPLDANELAEIRAIYQANTFYDPSAKQRSAR